MPVADAITRELRAALAAVTFLTCLPVGRGFSVDREDVARGALTFPLVGAAIGAAAGEFGRLLSEHLTTLVAGSLALALAVALTGALHLDGLADTADALGGRSPEYALAIMRDSRVGSYGVAAVTLVLIVEAGALGAVVATHRIAEIAVAFALSRAVAPAIAAALPYARPGAGTARPLASGGQWRALFAALLATSLVLLLDPRRGWALLACAACCGVVAGAFFRSRFGGMTGDTLGAAIAVTEALCLVVSSAR